ncbi:MAG TPA: PKD domain-containing protein, partial [Conexibacter sp.]|nr:PKD domain-containing protein [Conexibacter sp.]
MRLRRAALLPVLVALALPAGAGAAGWGPTRLFPGGMNDPYQTSAALSDRGDLGVLAIQGAPSSTTLVGGVVRRDGTVIPPPPTSDLPYQPAVAFDATGAAIAVWTTPVARAIHAARLAPGAATWTALPDAAGNDSAGPQLATDAAGTATLVYAGGGAVRSRTLAQGATSWGPVATLRDRLHNELQLRMAENADGRVAAVWYSDDTGTSTSIMFGAVRASASAAWTSAQLDETSGRGAGGTRELLDPVVAVGHRGGVAAGWEYEPFDDAFGTGDQARAIRWNDTVAGNWDAVAHHLTQPSGPSGAGYRAPGVAFAPDGSLLVAAAGGSPHAIDLFTVPAASTLWPAPQTVARVTSDPQLATTPTGATLIAHETTPDLHVEALARAPGASAFTAIDASDAHSSESFALATDGLGDAAVVYPAAVATIPNTIDARIYDAAPPQLSASVPATGAAGRLLPFTAGVSDVWSPLASVAWTFGDGNGGAGASLSHAFAAPGSYTATVTAADALGNVASASGTTSAVAAGGTQGG